MKIYLAIPYSGFEEESFRVANKIAAKLMNEGHLVFSPISHTHPIALAGNLPIGWEYWKKFDESFLEWCDTLYVIIMDNNGTERIEASKGVNGEMNITTSLSKPIIYIHESGDIGDLSRLLRQG
jgi:hypothetical protein